MCRAFFQRYFYNNTANECQQFVYGGCGGNGNNYKSLEECAKQCDTGTTQKQSQVFDKSACLLKSAPGPCYAYFERFFYNTRTSKCEQFVYGGCQGNANRFSTEAECQQSCAFTANAANNDQVCNQTKEAGMCRGNFERYFYNGTAQECQQFIYGGCGGNQNNFESLEKCNSQCPLKSELKTFDKQSCLLASEPGPCYAYFPKYFFNSKTKKCEQFVYGGCRGNENRFDTEEECQNSCASTAAIDYAAACRLDKETGPCRGNIERFFYNDTAKECQSFIYGGCSGNPNNFESIQECAQKCSSTIKPSDKPICELEKETGPCLGLFEYYYHNFETKKCEKFFYGGCKGNGNRFDTEEECQKSCASTAAIDYTTVCKLGEETGLCRGNFERYFYNDTAKECQLFIYGGCGGNRNNFETIEECAQKCTKSVKFDKKNCNLKKEVGPCHAFIPSYFYNDDTNECESFVYGGCQGN